MSVPSRLLGGLLRAGTSNPFASTSASSSARAASTTVLPGRSHPSGLAQTRTTASAAVPSRASSPSCCSPAWRLLHAGRGQNSTSRFPTQPIARGLASSSSVRSDESKPPPNSAQSGTNAGDPADTPARSKGEERPSGGVDGRQESTLDVLRELSGVGRGPDLSDSTSTGRGRRAATDDDEDFQWTQRIIRGHPTPPFPTTAGRSVAVSQNDVAQAYRNLMGILRRNNVRNELRLQERYEKPNQMRRRLRSERHRRRFQDMVRKRVQLVMAIKARGG